MGYPHLVKKCGDCKSVKPVDDFYKSKRARDGYCRDCRRHRDRQRSEKANKLVAANIERDPFYYRRKKLMSMYGITQEQFEEMRAKQNGLCAICLKPEKRVLYGRVSYLVVDHNHATGRLRSLLCHTCNFRLGVIENEEFRLAAASYLESHK